MSLLRSRSWLCTLHLGERTPEPMQVLPTGTPIEYAVGQLEKGEDTGAIHWQFYVYFDKRRRLGPVKSAIVEWLGDYASTVHLERCRGTVNQCREYVTKPETRVGFQFEFGTRPTEINSGRDLLALFRSGLTLDPSDPSWDGVLLRFSRSRLDELSNLVKPKSRDPTIPFLCEVHYGPPGTGKSRSVFSSFPDAYIKSSGKWWDYYGGQQTCVMDDFDGSFMSFGDFKRFVDRYPMFGEIKGSFTPILVRHWIITTNVHPSHWWSLATTGQDGRAAIWRRISRVFNYTQVGDDAQVVEMDPGSFRLKFASLELEDPKGEKHK